MLQAALRSLLHQDENDLWVGGWSSPPLLRACTRLLDSAPADGNKAVGGALPELSADGELMQAVAERLMRALSHDVADTRKSALELLGSLHRHGMLLSADEAHVESDGVVERVVTIWHKEGV